MDFDLNLINNCGENDSFFRLYRWKPYCISLGANQSIDDIDFEKTTTDGIDVVKRPTGGRAILHAEEITYSFVAKLNKDISPRLVYNNISEALVNGLKKYHPALAECTLENKHPDLRNALKQPGGSLCFAVAAKSEVKFDGKKIIGSAQRKMGNYLLQHGSILCGSFHKSIVDYLNESTDIKTLLKTEMNNTTIEIESVTGEPVDYAKLYNSLKNGFEEYFRIKFTEIKESGSHEYS